MSILLCFVLSGFLIFFFADEIRKFDLIFYFIAMAFALELSYRMALHWYEYEVLYPKGLMTVMDLLEKGTLPTLIFIWVMFAGAFPNKWTIRKKIMICRGEISIIASILILPHIVYYFIEFLNGLSRLSKLSGLGLWGVLVGLVAGLVAGVIMLPLFVTSYKVIRKALGGKKWKSLQEYAYVFYGLVYLHILAEYCAKGEAMRDHFAMSFYTVSFLVYLCMRFSKWQKMKNKRRV